VPHPLEHGPLDLEQLVDVERHLRRDDDLDRRGHLLPADLELAHHASLRRRH
jgi:hypothetical protein